MFVFCYSSHNSFQSSFLSLTVITYFRSIYRRRRLYRVFRFRISRRPCRNTWHRSKLSRRITWKRLEAWYELSCRVLARNSNNVSSNVDRRWPTGWVINFTQISIQTQWSHFQINYFYKINKNIFSFKLN